ncbi:diguanylate cyclase [Kamptonema sp. UHCC 0994]|uniref:diguanylate cyclase n=1 Tax=Kamptonema sp. UHCC 0994 TaxID=3031329 RepID=UPI0023B9F9CC|nr:diguanylate cyclase [Kamptonema sp. UHCC 0994]MDF0554635.1 diguanylate cyclase [Kamptonema sp. UHCC 0994]
MIYRPTDRTAKVVLPPNQLLKILLVEDDPVDAELIEEFLDSVSNIEVQVKTVARLSLALKSLGEAEFDAILLDLSLPDSFGIDTVKSVKAQALTAPIVVLTSLNDENMAIEAVHCGAQDYLVKRGFSGQLLVRAVHYAIARSRTEEALRQVAQRERLLGRMIERIRSSIISISLPNGDLDYYADFPASVFAGGSIQLANILHKTVAEVRQFLKTDRVVIYRCRGSTKAGQEDEEGSAIASDGAFNSYVGSRDIDTPLAISCDWSSNTESFVAVEDISVAKLDADDKNLFAEFHIKAVLTVPIWQASELGIRKWDSEKWGDEEIDKWGDGEKILLPNSPNQNLLWGILAVYHCSNSRQWQQWEVDFLQQLANQVALAIQQSELYGHLEIANRKLQRLATTDELTGIANRRQFNRALNLEWRRCGRELVTLSLIICDIDFFKLYNDCCGHPAGDTCLVRVACAIASSIKRPADLAARYGGEEFTVLLPNTSIEGAIAVARAIRTSVETLKLPHPQSRINPYITLSFGIASVVPLPDTSSDTLIQSADRALYQAKAKGRNRICQVVSQPKS